MRDFLIIGPLPSANQGSIGGTTISFHTLVEFMKSRKNKFYLVKTNKFFFKGATVANAIYVISKTIVLIPFCKLVMLNANPRGAKFLTPLIYWYSRIWQKPFVFRMFGGDLIEVFESQNKKVQEIFKNTIFNADIVYLQTKRLINYFDKFSDKIKWLPTSRMSNDTVENGKTYSKQFVFISQVKETKGLDLLIKLQDDLPEDFTVDIYGPILEDKYRFLEKTKYYKGLLKPEEVQIKLSNYDVLLLPTFHKGEGYPGIIIEANSLAIPVITTDWLALPELVLHEKTGILIEAKSYTALKKAIVSLDEKTHKNYSENALEWFNSFDSNKVNKVLLQELKSLI